MLRSPAPAAERAAWRRESRNSLPTNLHFSVELSGSLFSLNNYLILCLYVFGENTIAGLFGNHFILDYILNGLFMASLSMSNYLNQLSEKCHDLCEWCFDLFETICDSTSNLCETGIEKVFERQMHVPTIKNLSQEQRQIYQYIMLTLFIAIRCMVQDKTSTAHYIALESIRLCLVNLTPLLWIVLYNLVTNTQLWQGWLAIWETIKDQLYRQLWLRLLALWEIISEHICEGYLKMPGGLEPNRYHTRYFIGTNGLRLFEYGVFIQVLPTMSHVGIRRFNFCGIPIFNGDPVPVPAAPGG